LEAVAIPSPLTMPMVEEIFTQYSAADLREPYRSDREGIDEGTSRKIQSRYRLRKALEAVAARSHRPFLFGAHRDYGNRLDAWALRSLSRTRRSESRLEGQVGTDLGRLRHDGWDLAAFHQLLIRRPWVNLLHPTLRSAVREKVEICLRPPPLAMGPLSMANLPAVPSLPTIDVPSIPGVPSLPAVLPPRPKWALVGVGNQEMRLVATLAKFGGVVPEAGIQARVVPTDPYDNMDETTGKPALTNPDGQLKGCIALCQKGGIPYLQKARLAEEAGAVAVIVVQTLHPRTGTEEWPFTMEGKGGDRVKIPCLMLSLDDGATVEQASRQGRAWGIEGEIRLAGEMTWEEIAAAYLPNGVSRPYTAMRDLEKLTRRFGRPLPYSQGGGHTRRFLALLNRELYSRSSGDAEPMTHAKWARVLHRRPIKSLLPTAVRGEVGSYLKSVRPTTGMSDAMAGVGEGFSFVGELVGSVLPLSAMGSQLNKLKALGWSPSDDAPTGVVVTLPGLHYPLAGTPAGGYKGTMAAEDSYQGPLVSMAPLTGLILETKEHALLNKEACKGAVVCCAPHEGITPSQQADLAREAGAVALFILTEDASQQRVEEDGSLGDHPMPCLRFSPAMSGMIRASQEGSWKGMDNTAVIRPAGRPVNLSLLRAAMGQGRSGLIPDLPSMPTGLLPSAMGGGGSGFDAEAWLTVLEELWLVQGRRFPLSCAGRPGLSVPANHMDVTLWCAAKDRKSLRESDIAAFVEGFTSCLGPEAGSVALVGQATRMIDITENKALPRDGMEEAGLLDPDQVAMLSMPVRCIATFRFTANDPKAVARLASLFAKLQSAVQELPEKGALLRQCGSLWRVDEAHPLEVSYGESDPTGHPRPRYRRRFLALLNRWARRQGWEKPSEEDLSMRLSQRPLRHLLGKRLGGPLLREVAEREAKTLKGRFNAAKEATKSRMSAAAHAATIMGAAAAFRIARELAGVRVDLGPGTARTWIEAPGGGLRCVAVNAAFSSKVSKAGIRASMVMMRPSRGAPPVLNAKELKGQIAVCDAGGGVEAANKAQLAAMSGAVALVVLQEEGDTAEPRLPIGPDGLAPSIPACIIPAAQARNFRAQLASLDRGAGEELTARLFCLPDATVADTREAIEAIAAASGSCGEAGLIEAMGVAQWIQDHTPALAATPLYRARFEALARRRARRHSGRGVKVAQVLFGERPWCDTHTEKVRRELGRHRANVAAKMEQRRHEDEERGLLGDGFAVGAAVGGGMAGLFGGISGKTKHHGLATLTPCTGRPHVEACLHPSSHGFPDGPDFPDPLRLRLLDPLTGETPQYDTGLLAGKVALCRPGPDPKHSVEEITEVAKRHKCVGVAILVEAGEEWPPYRKQDSYPEPQEEEAHFPVFALRAEHGGESLIASIQAQGDKESLAHFSPGTVDWRRLREAWAAKGGSILETVDQMQAECKRSVCLTRTQPHRRRAEALMRRTLRRASKWESIPQDGVDMGDKAAFPQPPPPVVMEEDGKDKPPLPPFARPEDCYEPGALSPEWLSTLVTLRPWRQILSPGIRRTLPVWATLEPPPEPEPAAEPRDEAHPSFFPDVPQDEVEEAPRATALRVLHLSPGAYAEAKRKERLARERDEYELSLLDYSNAENAGFFAADKAAEQAAATVGGLADGLAGGLGDSLGLAIAGVAGAAALVGMSQLLPDGTARTAAGQAMVVDLEDETVYAREIMAREGERPMRLKGMNTGLTRHPNETYPEAYPVVRLEPTSGLPTVDNVEDLTGALVLCRLGENENTVVGCERLLAVASTCGAKGIIVTKQGFQHDPIMPSPYIAAPEGLSKENNHLVAFSLTEQDFALVEKRLTPTTVPREDKDKAATASPELVLRLRMGKRARMDNLGDLVEGEVRTAEAGAKREQLLELANDACWWLGHNTGRKFPCTLMAEPGSAYERRYAAYLGMRWRRIDKRNSLLPSMPSPLPGSDLMPAVPMPGKKGKATEILKELVASKPLRRCVNKPLQAEWKATEPPPVDPNEQSSADKLAAESRKAMEEAETAALAAAALAAAKAGAMAGNMLAGVASLIPSQSMSEPGGSLGRMLLEGEAFPLKLVPAKFGSLLPPEGLQGIAIACWDPMSGADLLTGEPLVGNGGSLKGKLALCDMGELPCTRKAILAASHGAKALLVCATKEEPEAFAMDDFGRGEGVSIPIGMACFEVAERIKAALARREPQTEFRCSLYKKDVDLEEMSQIYHSGHRVDCPGMVLGHLRNFLSLQYRVEPLSLHSSGRAEAVMRRDLDDLGLLPRFPEEDDTAGGSLSWEGFLKVASLRPWRVYMPPGSRGDLPPPLTIREKKRVVQPPTLREEMGSATNNLLDGVKGGVGAVTGSVGALAGGVADGGDGLFGGLVALGGGLALVGGGILAEMDDYKEKSKAAFMALAEPPPVPGRECRRLLLHLEGEPCHTLVGSAQFGDECPAEGGIRGNLALCDPSNAEGEIRNGAELAGRMVLCVHFHGGSIRRMIEALGPHKPAGVLVVRMAAPIGLHSMGEKLADGHPTCATLSEADGRRLIARLKAAQKEDKAVEASVFPPPKLSLASLKARLATKPVSNEEDVLDCFLALWEETHGCEGIWHRPEHRVRLVGLVRRGMLKYKESWNGLEGLSPEETARAVALFNKHAQMQHKPTPGWLPLETLCQLLPEARGAECSLFLGVQWAQPICLADWCEWLTDAKPHIGGSAGLAGLLNHAEDELAARNRGDKVAVGLSELQTAYDQVAVGTLSGKETMIDVTELEACYKVIELLGVVRKVPEDQLILEIDRIDANADGKLSIEEFRNLLEALGVVDLIEDRPPKDWLPPIAHLLTRKPWRHPQGFVGEPLAQDLEAVLAAEVSMQRPRPNPRLEALGQLPRLLLGIGAREERIMAIPAAFSQPLPSCRHSLTGPLVAMDPVTGSIGLNPEQNLNGKVVICRRGGPSFPTQCRLAKRQGALALVVVQSGSRWPFRMENIPCPPLETVLRQCGCEAHVGSPGFTNTTLEEIQNLTDVEITSRGVNELEPRQALLAELRRLALETEGGEAVDALSQWVSLEQSSAAVSLPCMMVTEEEGETLLAMLQPRIIGGSYVHPSAPVVSIAAQSNGISVAAAWRRFDQTGISTFVPPMLDESGQWQEAKEEEAATDQTNEESPENEAASTEKVGGDPPRVAVLASPVGVLSTLHGWCTSMQKPLPLCSSLGGLQHRAVALLRRRLWRGNRSHYQKQGGLDMEAVAETFSTRRPWKQLCPGSLQESLSFISIRTKANQAQGEEANPAVAAAGKERGGLFGAIGGGLGGMADMGKGFADMMPAIPGTTKSTTADDDDGNSGGRKKTKLDLDTPTPYQEDLAAMARAREALRSADDSPGFEAAVVELCRAYRRVKAAEQAYELRRLVRRAFHAHTKWYKMNQGRRLALPPERLPTPVNFFADTGDDALGGFMRTRKSVTPPLPDYFWLRLGVEDADPKGFGLLPLSMSGPVGPWGRAGRCVVVPRELLAIIMKGAAGTLPKATERQAVASLAQKIESSGPGQSIGGSLEGTVVVARLPDGIDAHTLSRRLSLLGCCGALLLEEGKPTPPRGLAVPDEEVEGFLQEVGLGQHFQSFLDAKVTYEMLPVLTTKQLIHLGIKKLGERHLYKQALKEGYKGNLVTIPVLKVEERHLELGLKKHWEALGDLGLAAHISPGLSDSGREQSLATSLIVAKGAFETHATELYHPPLPDGADPTTLRVSLPAELTSASLKIQKTFLSRTADSNSTVRMRLGSLPGGDVRLNALFARSARRAEQDGGVNEPYSWRDFQTCLSRRPWVQLVPPSVGGMVSLAAHQEAARRYSGEKGLVPASVEDEENKIRRAAKAEAEMAAYKAPKPPPTPKASITPKAMAAVVPANQVEIVIGGEVFTALRGELGAPFAAGAQGETMIMMQPHTGVNMDGQAECENASALSGKVVVCLRGGVPFEKKAKMAALHGAKALVVVNTQEEWPFYMPRGPKDTIPCAMVSQEDGKRLLPQLDWTDEGAPATVTGAQQPVTAVDASSSAPSEEEEAAPGVEETIPTQEKESKEEAAAVAAAAKAPPEEDAKDEEGGLFGGLSGGLGAMGGMGASLVPRMSLFGGDDDDKEETEKADNPGGGQEEEAESGGLFGGLGGAMSGLGLGSLAAAANPFSSDEEEAPGAPPLAPTDALELSVGSEKARGWRSTSFSCTAAEFGSTTSDVPLAGLAAAVCVMEPIDNVAPKQPGGDPAAPPGLLCVNQAAIKGRIALCKRGGVPYAFKAKLAEEAGAVGLVVINTGDEWPFVMRTPEGTWQATIPCGMISEQDGAKLLALVERAAGAPGLSEAVLQGLLRQGEARRSRYRQVGGLRDGHQDIAATLRALQDGEDKLATLSYLGESAEEPPVSRVPGTEAPRWEAEEERQAVNNQLEARANAAAKAAAEREVAAKVEQEAAEREAAEKEAAAARKIFGAHAAPIASGGEEVVTQEAKPKEHIESFASMGHGHLDKMRRQLGNVPAGPQREKLEKKLAVMERKVEQMQSIKEKQTSQESGGNAQGQGQNFDHLAPLANILMEAQEEDSSSEEEE